MPAGPVEGLTGKTVNGETLRVREVWADNLHEEIAIIRDIVEDYPYVAMDTEFPGVVARPVGNFKSSREYHYKVSSWPQVWCHVLHAALGGTGGCLLLGLCTSLGQPRSGIIAAIMSCIHRQPWQTAGLWQHTKQACRCGVLLHTVV